MVQSIKKVLDFILKNKFSKFNEVFIKSLFYKRGKERRFLANYFHFGYLYRIFFDNAWLAKSDIAKSCS